MVESSSFVDDLDIRFHHLKSARRGVPLADCQDGVGPDEETRRAIAERIEECAQSGERDPDKLRVYGLADLTVVSEGGPQGGSVPSERSD